jgi:hypothetical protein
MRLKRTENCPRRGTFSLRIFLPRTANENVALVTEIATQPLTPEEAHPSNSVHL